MFDPSCALQKRFVTCLILHAMRDVIPHQTSSVSWLLIDADDPVAGLVEEFHDFAPPARVVPILCLGRALRRDADVGLLNWPTLVGEHDARRYLRGVDTQDVAGGTMQPDMSKVTWLMHTV